MPSPSFYSVTYRPISRAAVAAGEGAVAQNGAWTVDDQEVIPQVPSGRQGLGAHACLARNEILFANVLRQRQGRIPSELPRFKVCCLGRDRCDVARRDCEFAN